MNTLKKILLLPKYKESLISGNIIPLLYIDQLAGELGEVIKKLRNQKVDTFKSNHLDWFSALDKLNTYTIKEHELFLASGVVNVESELLDMLENYILQLISLFNQSLNTNQLIKDKERKVLEQTIEQCNGIYKIFLNSCILTEVDIFRTAKKVPSHSTRPNSTFPQNKSGAETYVSKQLDLIRYFTEILRNITDKDFIDNGRDYVALRKHYTETLDKHYSCLFILTAIGQSARNLFTEKDNHSEIFFKAGGAGLALEIEFIRWIRNSLAHAAESIQNIEEKGFIFDCFANNLLLIPIHIHGGRRLEVSEYLLSLLTTINSAKGRIERGEAVTETEPRKKFDDLMLKNQLLKHHRNTDKDCATIVLSQLLGTKIEEKNSLDEAEKILNRGRQLDLETIAIKQDDINKLASVNSIEILGFFGKIASFGYMDELDNGGMLVNIPRTPFFLKQLAELKTTLRQLLGFPIKVVTPEQIIEFFSSREEYSTTYRDKAEQFILLIRNKYGLTQLVNGYKLRVAWNAEDYGRVREMIQSQQVNLDLVLVSTSELDFEDKMPAEAAINLQLANEDLILLLVQFSQAEGFKRSFFAWQLIEKVGSVKNLRQVADYLIDAKEQDVNTLIIKIGSLKKLKSIAWVLKTELAPYSGIFDNMAFIHRLIQDYDHHNTEETSIEKNKIILEIFQLIIQQGANVNVQDKYGNTPLMYCVMDIRKEFLDILLQDSNLEFNVQSPDEMSALHYAVEVAIPAKNENISHRQYALTKLLAKNIDVNNGAGGLKGTPLHIAAKSCNYNAMLALINAGADVNALDDQGFNPLHCVISVGYDRGERGYVNKKNVIKCIELLLQNKAQVFAKFTEGDSVLPLHWALKTGYPTLALQMLECITNKDEINFQDNHGVLPLHIALRKYLIDEGIAQYYQVVVNLVEKGSKLNVKDSWTPLQIAVQYSDYKLVRLLIEYGADLNIKNVLDDALSTNYEIARYLIEHGANADFDMLSQDERFANNTSFKTFLDSCKRLFDAVEEGDFVKFKKAHRSGIPLNIRNSVGNIPLCIALQKDNIEILTYLLENGSSFDRDLKVYYISTKGSLRSSSVYNEIGIYSIKVILLLNQKKLLEWDKIEPYVLQKISTRAIKQKCWDLLSQIDSLGCLNVQLELLKDLPQPLNKYYILYQTIQADDLEQFKKLLEEYSGAISSFHNFAFEGRSILHVAVQKKAVKITNYILEQSIANIDLMDSNEQTPLYIACENQQQEMIKLLLDFGANANPDSGEKPLDVCIPSDDSQINHNTLNLVTTLIQYGADINYQGYQGKTLLHRSVEYNEVNTVSMLLQLPGIDVNIYDDIGRTALHIAIDKDKSGELVKMLCIHLNIDLGAKRYIFSEFLTPLNYACEADNYNAIKTLVKRGTSIGNDLGPVLLYALKNQDNDFITEILQTSTILDNDSLASFTSTWKSKNFIAIDYEDMHQYWTNIKSTILIPGHIYKALDEMLQKSTKGLGNNNYHFT
jgi:ankyrin repeat protein